MAITGITVNADVSTIIEEEAILAERKLVAFEDELDIADTVLSGYAAGIASKRNWQALAGYMIHHKIQRKDAIKTLAARFPAWPLGKDKLPVGKGNKELEALCLEDSELKLIWNSINAFTGWCSHNLTKDKWEYKPLPTVTKVTAATKKGEAKKADNNKVTVEAPTEAQMAELSELQHISAFVKMVRGSDKFDDDMTALVEELCQDLASAIEPELVKIALNG